MTAPTTVLVVHAADEAYGADRVLLLAIRGLTERGWRFSVLLPDDVPRGWLSGELERLGVEVRRTELAIARRRRLRPTGLAGWARDLIVARRRIREAATRVDAHLVHVNTTAVVVAAIVGRPNGARLLWHAHEIVVRPRGLAWAFRLLPGVTSDRVVAVSDAVRRHLTPRGFASRRVTTIRNGLPERRPPERGAPGSQPPVVAYVGRLNRWKGYELFVDAAAIVADRVPEARFVLAGDPPLGESWRRADVARRVQALGLASRLDLLGFVEDGAGVLETADVAVVPSTWPDPLPTVILEAMRAGCAVVAAEHGGAPEMIEDGVSGRLVPPGDVQALASAIEALVRDPAGARAIGEAARRRVGEAFSVGRMVDDLEAIYRELVR